MARGAEIRCRAFIGSERDGYVPLESLTEEELEAWRERAAERIGNALSDYYSQHMDEYIKLGA